MKAAKGLMCAVAAGVIALAPMAQAQDSSTTTTTTTTTTPMMTGTAAMSSTPMQASGTVLRYYTNRLGYVTAMDVQTANGVELVRFSPGMGQKLYSMYPVGSTANVWLQANGMTRSGKPRNDLVGVGNDTPTTWMTPYTMTSADLLDAEPFIVSGAKEVDVKGWLRNVITNDEGEVVGLVLGGASVAHMKHMADGTMASSTSTAMTGADTGAMMSGGMMSGGMTMMGSDTVLVRVPRNFRHVSPGHLGTNRVIPLFHNASVRVTGWPEAPVYGVLSRYNDRVSATAIVVNGRAVGPLGFPLMVKGRSKTLLALDLLSNSKSADEANAMSMGYSVYDPTGSMADSSSSTGTTSMSTSTTPSTTTTTP